MVAPPDTQQQQQENKKIKAPTTTDDDGSPSDSCVDDMERVLRLIEDERHLAAQTLYHNVLNSFGWKRSGW